MVSDMDAMLSCVFNLCGVRMRIAITCMVPMGYFRGPPCPPLLTQFLDYRHIPQLRGLGQSTCLNPTDLRNSKQGNHRNHMIIRLVSSRSGYYCPVLYYSMAEVVHIVYTF